MFRRINSGEWFYLQREINSKENAKIKSNIFMNMEIVTNHEAAKLG